MDFKCDTFLDKLVVIFRGIGLIFLYMVGTVLLAAIAHLTPLVKSNTGKSIAYILIDVIVLTILCVLFAKRLKVDFKDFKKNWRKYLRIVIPYYILGVIVMMVSNIVINTIINNGGLAANESANREILSGYPIASVISMCIMGPICEELLFRASFKNAFKNIVTYCLFTGILFAGVHVANGINSWNILTIISKWRELLYFIPYSAVGVAFSYAFYKTDNIFSSISLHILHNSLTVALLLLATLGGA